MKTLSTIGLFMLVMVLAFGFTWGVTDLYKVFVNGYEIRTVEPQRVKIEIEIKQTPTPLILELEPEIPKRERRERDTDNVT